MKFYQCAHCGNQIIMLKDSGVPVVCCGEPMKQLIPGETDASLEKHVPDAVQKEQVVQVQVGRIAHPMTPEHRIEWIVLETNCGYLVRFLKPDEPPAAFLSWAVRNSPSPRMRFATCTDFGKARCEKSRSAGRKEESYEKIMVYRPKLQRGRRGTFRQ